MKLYDAWEEFKAWLDEYDEDERLPVYVMRAKIERLEMKHE